LQEQERPLLVGLLQGLEQAPFRGQGLPPPSRGREKLGQCRSQNADTRSQNSRKGKDLQDLGQSPACQRRTMYDVRENEPCYVLGLWFL
jgi:hypothetical protein